MSFPGFVPGQVSALGLRWSSNLALCPAEPQELGRIIPQWFCEGNLCVNDTGALSQCHLEQGDGSFGWSPLLRGVRRKAGVLMGFDLEAKAAAGLESPPGADLLDVINTQWECGAGGKPGGLLGSSNSASRAAL